MGAAISKGLSFTEVKEIPLNELELFFECNQAYDRFKNPKRVVIENINELPEDESQFNDDYSF